MDDTACSLSALPNIGPTIERRLRAVGIESADDLRRTGAVGAYRLMSARFGGYLPVCYYLYSLHAALDSRDWRELTDEEKSELLAKVGL